LPNRLKVGSLDTSLDRIVNGRHFSIRLTLTNGTPDSDICIEKSTQVLAGLSDCVFKSTRMPASVHVIHNCGMWEGFHFGEVWMSCRTFEEMICKQNTLLKRIEGFYHPYFEAITIRESVDIRQSF
jgi:hypothetical protein